MYKEFYGFAQKPFSLLPNPEFMFMGQQHSVALSVMDYALIDEAGFIVITGEIGTGKTTLIRHLLKQLETSNQVTVGLVSNTLKSFGEMMQWILLAYGLDYKGKSNVELYQDFVDFLIGEYANGNRVVLIIDEAQNMDIDMLEELRVLSNINADKDQILQMILVGQPQLRYKLKNKQLEQFAQRIVADYHLRSLSKADAIEYIQHRLSVAGGRRDIFDESAYNYIAYFSKGVPRLINSLCDMALIYGFVNQKSSIDSETVIEVVNDKLRGGLSPIRRPSSEKDRKKTDNKVMHVVTS
jgi:type II secretory pathway predicted ATPase ExeA